MRLGGSLALPRYRPPKKSIENRLCSAGGRNLMKPTGKPSRTDPRAAVRRDSSRLARREPGHRTFWRSLGVVGMVGWPIALGSVGGTFVGRYLDSRFDTGIRLTLMLMTAGLLAGCFTAWKTVAQKND